MSRIILLTAQRKDTSEKWELRGDPEFAVEQLNLWLVNETIVEITVLIRDVLDD